MQLTPVLLVTGQCRRAHKEADVGGTLPDENALALQNTLSEQRRRVIQDNDVRGAQILKFR